MTRTNTLLEMRGRKRKHFDRKDKIRVCVNLQICSNQGLCFAVVAFHSEHSSTRAVLSLFRFCELVNSLLQQAQSAATVDHLPEGILEVSASRRQHTAGSPL